MLAAKKRLRGNRYSLNRLGTLLRATFHMSSATFCR